MTGVLWFALWAMQLNVAWPKYIGPCLEHAGNGMYTIRHDAPILCFVPLPVASDAFDVPAVRHGYICACGQPWPTGEKLPKGCKMDGTDNGMCSGPAPKPEWSCADKSRVLLTSEDGKRHCIKLEAR